MDILLLWLAFSTIAGMIAHNRRRSGIGFFLLAVALSPLVGILAAIVVQPGVPDRTGQKKCPQCAEWISKEAKLCKHCGTPFDQTDATTAKTCPYCGHTLSATASTCGKCGRIQAS